jgi:hypothetical protein
MTQHKKEKPIDTHENMDEFQNIHEAEATQTISFCMVLCV